MSKRRSIFLFLATSFLCATPIFNLRGNASDKSTRGKFVKIRWSRKTLLIKKSISPLFQSLQCRPLDTVIFDHHEKQGNTVILLKTEKLVVPAAPTHPILYTFEEHGFNLALYPKGQPCKTKSMKLI